MHQTKIYCPVDFSEAANNAVEYAANFGKNANAALTLVYYQNLPLEYSGEKTLGVLKAFEDPHNEIINRLKDYCISIREEFKIECNYSEEFYIGEVNRENNIFNNGLDDLIIMGTNGADTLYQFYFGTNSYRLAKRVDFPVLVVPDQCSYQTLKSIVYISDHIKGEDIAVQQLLNFLRFFKVSLKILHISESDTAESQESYQSLQTIFKEKLDLTGSVEFIQAVNMDPADEIEKFAHRTEPDIIAISMKDHDIVYRIFHQNLIKKLSTYIDYPMLITHK